MIDVKELEQKYHFCFLDMHYVDTQNDEDLYELSLSTKHFDKSATMFIDKNKLKELADSTLIMDFKICDGYLQCNPHLPELNINSVIKDYANDVLEETSDRSTFYDLVRTGVENEFILIDNSMEEIDTTNDWRLVKFNHIQFSQSTMSVYVQIQNSQGELKNKMIITRDAGTLVLHPFLFGVPADVEFEWAGCQYIKHQEIRGSMYKLYYASDLAVFVKTSLISKSTINKAVNLRARYNIIIKIMSEFKKEIWSKINNVESVTFKWVGGNKSYSSEYGVIFESSLKMPTKEARMDLIEFIQLERIKNKISHNEFVQKLQDSSTVDVLSSAGRTISIILEQCESIDHALLMISSTLDVLYNELIYCDLFLYKIRSSLYLSRQRLTTIGNPFLFGGDETAYTTVKEGFFYEIEG